MKFQFTLIFCQITLLLMFGQMFVMMKSSGDEKK